MLKWTLENWLILGLQKSIIVQFVFEMVWRCVLWFTTMFLNFGLFIENFSFSKSIFVYCYKATKIK
jgi:hypothetical protein